MWVKGNTHTHTTNSDGRSSPRETAQWYKDHGYGFLVITDHHKFTDPDELIEVQSNSFILIPGEELTSHPDPQGKPVHVCALGINRLIEDPEKETPLDTLRFYVGEILKKGGLPIVCHPNFKYGLDYKVMQEAANWDLFEIYNHSSNCHNEGSIARLPVEQIWDILLSGGRDCWAVAADDAHHIGESREENYPGGGWVWVQVERLSAENVICAMASGDFYSTTGPELKNYTVDDKSIRIEVKPEKGIAYTVRFIGKHGQILQEVERKRTSYKFKGGPEEEYVRVKIIASDGSVAWTQPVRRTK